MSNSGQRNTNRPTSAPIVHVVDDDESFRTAIARLLRTKNYEVRTYTSASDFLSAYERDAPGCIVLDLRMPGFSGLAFQEVLATRPDQLPIIFVSGHGEIRARALAIKAGAIAFLYKPVEPKDLFEAIEKALNCDAENRLARERLRQVTPESAPLATEQNHPAGAPSTQRLPAKPRISQTLHFQP